MRPEELKSRIQTIGADASVEVTDTTGTEDHYEAIVVTEKFSGKSRMDRHQMIMALLMNEMRSGDVHALSLKTYTPEEWNEFKKRKQGK